MASRATLAFIALAFCAAVVAGDAAAAEGGRQLLSQSNSNTQAQLNSQSTGNFAAIFNPKSPFSSVGVSQANFGSNFNGQGQSQVVGQTNVKFGRKLSSQSNSNTQAQQNSQSAGNYAAIFSPWSPFSSIAVSQGNGGSNFNFQGQGQEVGQTNVNFGRKLSSQSNNNAQVQQNAQTAGNYFSVYVPSGIIAAAQANSGSNVNFQWQGQGVSQTNFEGRKLLDQTNNNQQVQENEQSAGNYFSVSVPFALLAAAQANSGSNHNYQFQWQDVSQTNKAGRKLLDQTNNNQQIQQNQQSAGNYAILHIPYGLVALSQSNSGSNYNSQQQGQWVYQSNVDFGRKLLGDQTNNNQQIQQSQQTAGNYAILHIPYSLVALAQGNSGSNYNSQSQGQWVYQTNIKG